MGVEPRFSFVFCKQGSSDCSAAQTALTVNPPEALVDRWSCGASTTPGEREALRVAATLRYLRHEATSSQAHLVLSKAHVA